MSRKFFSVMIVFVVLIIGFFCSSISYAVETVDAFPGVFKLQGYWVGADNCKCKCTYLCECGAEGFMETKSFLGVKIDYRFYKCPKQPTAAEKRRAKQLEEEEREKKLQKLSNSCDPGWILVDNHCESCDSSETFKVS